MMEIVYRSIFKKEMSSFIEIVKLSVKDYQAYQRTLADFDSFLYSEGITGKRIEAELVSRWLDAHINIKLQTKKSKLSHIKRFSRYLSSTGIELSLPELPRKSSDFVPYVFTSEEMAQIFDLADDLVLTLPNSKIAAEFPILLRILYGCGLRLGEARTLTWDDIDLNDGVIKVRIAKNDKQRMVPMSDELTRILKLYQKAPCFEMKEHGFLFKTVSGKPRSGSAYWCMFHTILCELGIKNTQTTKYGARGPCIHSLRHTFTMHSFLKAESEGRGFMETVPFLSTYLGHEGLMQTDIYLKARHELYTESHQMISEYTQDIFPEEV